MNWNIFVVMKLFQHKYRTDSNRLKHWDYSNNGYYFLTICTKNREHFFGEIEDGEMLLNAVGKLVNDEWYKSEKIRKHIILDEFIIMPNHIHGIVIIDNDLSHADVPADPELRRDVPAEHLYVGKHPKMSKISPKKIVNLPYDSGIQIGGYQNRTQNQP